MSKYSNAVEAMVHAHKEELEVMDRGREYFRLVEGSDPMPLWIVEVAKGYGRGERVVLNDALRYRFGMKYQYDKISI